jgi:predicted NAD-dependent protein-ADP-ribosyltransferase YbiA (DUF1768 family)
MSCKYKYEKDGIYREFETEQEILDFLQEYEMNGILPEEINTNPSESPFSFRTIKGFATTSNEMNLESGSENKGAVVDSMNNFLENYSDKPFPTDTGKLMSRFSLFEKLGINIEEVRNYISEYWNTIGDKNPTQEEIDNAFEGLPEELRNAAEESALKWLFTKKISATNIEKYGNELTYSNKFDVVCGRTYSLVLLDQNNNVLRTNLQGELSEKGIALAWQMPIVEKDGNKFKFKNIQVEDSEAVQKELSQLYDIQEKFKKDTKFEAPIKDIEISKGANVNKPIKTSVKEAINIETSGENKGKTFTAEGNKRVFTEMISPQDAMKLAKVRFNKNFEKSPEAKLFFNSMVGLKNDSELIRNYRRRIADGEMLIQEAMEDFAKNVLEKRWYNIPLVNEFPNVTVNDKLEIIVAKKPISKFEHLAKIAYTETPGKTVNKKLYFNLDNEIKPSAVPSRGRSRRVDKGDMPKLLSKNASLVLRDQEIKAMRWFTKSFLSEGIAFNPSFLQNTRAFADFTNVAITLYQGSNYTHLYHEAWHRFTQHFLTLAERTNLYDAISDLTGISENDLLQSEETLAEGFRSLMLSEGKTITLEVNGKTFTINMEAPKAKEKSTVAWYKKVLDFFKSLFKSQNTFQDYYDTNVPLESRLQDVEELIKKYMLEASNVKTTRTNLYKTNNGNSAFEQLYSLRTTKYESTTTDDVLELDSLSMYDLQQGIDGLFVNLFKEYYPGQNIAILEYQTEEVKKDVYNRIYDFIWAKFDDLSIDESIPEEKRKEYRILTENFEAVIKATDGFRASINKYYDEDIEIDENIKLNTADIHEKKGHFELVENTIIKMLQTLPKIKNGKQETSDIWGLPLLADFGATWGTLQSNLAGKNYAEMLKQIKLLAQTKNPEFGYLLESLPVTLEKDSDLYLKAAFEQAFNYNLNEPIITYLEQNDKGGINVKVGEAGSPATKQVLKKWINANSVFTSVQLSDLVSNYESFNTLENINLENALAFLKDLNFEFTDLDMEYAISQGYKEKSLYESIQYIYSVIKEHSRYSANFNPIAQIIRDKSVQNAEGNYVIIKGESKSLETVAKLETLTNRYINDDMVIRADGTPEWKMKQYNYMSRLLYNMEHMSKEELMEVYPQFDRSKNPGIIFSPMYNSLFTENGEYNKSGAKLKMFSMTGLTDMDKLDGLVTVDMKAPEQALNDFWSFLVSGKEQFTRFGDKSSAFGMTVSTWKTPLEETSIVKYNNNLLSLLQAEIYNYQHFKLVESKTGFPKSSKQNSHKNKGLILFDKIIKDKDLKDRLLAAELSLNEVGEISLSRNLELLALAEIETYFKEKAVSFKNLLLKNVPEGFSQDSIIPSQTNKSLDELIELYLKASTSNRMDTFLFLFGDLKNFKSGNDVYKRLSSNSSTGLFPITDQESLEKLGSRKIEDLYRTENSRDQKITSKFTVTQFNNVPVNLSELLLNAEQDEKAKEALKEYVKLDGENKGDRADAQGAVTLDFYRTINNLIGRWNVSQEKAYQAQVNFMEVKQKYNKSDSEYIEALENANKTASDLLILWNPKKWQYSGSVLSKHTVAKDLDIRMFLKFSIAPLIPSVIENTKLENVAENMYRTGTDLYTFNSGSKNSTDQESQIFSTWAKSQVEDYIPTTLSLHNFKEQLPIEDSFKQEAIFASQMRALLASGLYENGKPVKDVTDYTNYKGNLNNLAKLATIDLKEKISTPEKLVKFLEKEFDKREIPSHIKEFVSMYKDNPGFKFDTSFQSYYILNTLFSIVTKNIIKPKYNGGQFVQVSDLGYTNASYKDNALYGNKELKFYPINEDGSSGKAEIKIALSPKYKGLLNLTGIDGERIGDIKRLNEALSNKEWIAQHGDKVTLVACRIPVQSFSTIESFIVKEFLPEVAGQIVIVPPGLTIKTGSDFDIDKLNIYEPKIDRNGNLVKVESKDIVKEYQDAIEIQKEVEQEIKELEEENKLLKEKVRTEDVPLLETLEIEEEESEFGLSALPTGSFSLEDLKSTIKPFEKQKEKLDVLQNIEKLRSIYEKNINTIRGRKRELRDIKNYKENIPFSQVNEMINNISKLVLTKDNRSNLLQPNEIKELDVLLIESGIGKKEDSTISLSDAIDIEVSNQVGQVNFESKGSLGIAAKMNKAFAVFQEVGIRLVRPMTSLFLDNKENTGWLSERMTKAYKGTIPLFNVKDNSIVNFTKFKEPLDKIQILSQFVSGTVDVANDPRIGRINFNKKTASVYIHGILKGIHLYDLASIMMNPNVMELIDSLNKTNYLFFKHLIGKSKLTEAEKAKLTNKSRIKEQMLRSLITEDIEVWTIDDQGREVFDMFATIENINKQTGVSFNDAKAVGEYIKLEEEAKFTTELSMATSWDTNSSKSFVEYEYGDRKVKELILKGIFEAEGLNKIMTDSSISSLRANDFINEEYSKLFSIINNPLFMELILEKFDGLYGVKLESFVKDMTNGLMTYIYQNYSGDYQKYIVDKQTLTRDNPNNLEQRLIDLKSRLNNTKFKDNYFLKQLVFKKDQESNFINPITLSVNLTPMQQTLYHEELVRLLYSEYSNDPETNIEIREWANDLIHSALVLNGPVKKVGSILDFIPQTELMSYTQTIANFNITEEELDLFFERFLKLNSTKYAGKYSKNDVIHFNNYFTPIVQLVVEDEIVEDVAQQSVVETNLPTEDVKINIYAGTNENAELSNFAIRPTTYNTAYVEGLFMTPEGAFQAAKINYTENVSEEIKLQNSLIFEKLKTSTGSQAKSLGRTIKGLNQKQWDEDSSDIMLDILIDSFTQNPKALQTLLATGNAILTHTQDKGKWGTEFPRLLMEVRNELREKGFNNNTVSNQVNNIQPVVESNVKPKRFIISPETTSRIMKGSVIEYKNAEGVNKWLVWNITEQDKLQLIGLDGSKFSGTPNKDSKNITKILGAYATTVDESTGVDVIVTDNNNIYSTATGDKLYENNDGSSLKKRKDIIDSLPTIEPKQPNIDPVKKKMMEQLAVIKKHAYSPIKVILMKGMAPIETYFELREIDNKPIVNPVGSSIFVTTREGIEVKFEEIEFPEDPGTNEICEK